MPDSIERIILAQNDDWTLKWANGPYPFQVHAPSNFDAPFEIFMALCKI